MQLVTITAPDTAVVTVAEAKDQMSLLDDTSQDTRIEALIAAATRRVENECGMRLYTQTVELRLDGFPGKSDTIDLMVAPVQSVDSVKYDDTDDTEQTWASSNYWEDLLGTPARLTAKTSFPTAKSGKPASVRIRMTVGHATADAVDEHFKLAIKMLVAHWFVSPSAVSEAKGTPIPFGVRDLLWSDPENHFLVL